MRGRVLIVEDEPFWMNTLRNYLKPEGFELFEVRDSEAGVDAVRRYKPDIVVLDWMFPNSQFDGLEALKRIRRFDSTTYVCMVSVREAEHHKISAIESGADDYMTKPIGGGELLARLRRMLTRRFGNEKVRVYPPPLRFKELTIDRGRREAHLADKKLHLTAKEFDLLVTLADGAGYVFNYRQLLELVWDDFVTTRTNHVVKVHVGNLRVKLGDDSQNPRFIQNIRGMGYRFLD